MNSALQYSNRKVTAVAGALLTLASSLPLILVAAIAVAETSPAELKVKAIECTKSGDLPCAERNWSEYAELRPTDTRAVANLAIILNKRDKHEAAIVQFERVLDTGAGAYDLFAYYADSLAKTGKTTQAIEWFYKTLAVVPRLVDVRGDLAKLLVAEKRYYEALALLGAFDAQLEDQGKKPFFLAQRIAIEALLDRNTPLVQEATVELRLSKFGDHFYAPVSFGQSRATAFMVDTGASNTVVSESFLASSKAVYKVTKSSVEIKIADGRVVKGKAVKLDAVKIGPFELTNVIADACENCSHLLGQTTLSQFDLKSSKVQGVEFLTLTKRSKKEPLTK